MVIAEVIIVTTVATVTTVHVTCFFILDVFSNALPENPLLLVMQVFEGPACAR
jgi:hypothetical protein